MKLLFPMILRDCVVEIECEFTPDGVAEERRITDRHTLETYDWELTEIEEYKLQQTAATEAQCALSMPDPDELAYDPFFSESD